MYVMQQTAIHLKLLSFTIVLIQQVISSTTITRKDVHALQVHPKASPQTLGRSTVQHSDQNVQRIITQVILSTILANNYG